MRLRRAFVRRHTRRHPLLTPLITSTTALAVLAGLSAQLDLLDRFGRDASTAPVADSYDGLDIKATEQLLQDQCVMAGVLRMGGPAMYGTAQDALNQTPDKLHAAADQEYWNSTPLSRAYDLDRQAADKEGEALNARLREWQKPLLNLETPSGFTSLADFQNPPGMPGSDQKDFFDQTGLASWVGKRMWLDEYGFYNDPTPRADAATVEAVKKLGVPLYGKDPDPGLPTSEWTQAYEEHEAWKRLTENSARPTGSDDARLFLASGGFPRTAPDPDSVEFRIAVEDLKTRFASCAWRMPVDPNKVLGKTVAAASAEWQQEIAGQAPQRNQILTSNLDATKALGSGAKALGELLGQSWIADHLARWQDYWSPGGAGWLGDTPIVFEVRAAAGKCLDVQSASKDNGAPVQVYTCNGTAAQKWTAYQDDRGLHLSNLNSQKCLDVKSGGAANGTGIQQWTCNGSPAQSWDASLAGTTQLKNTGSGRCLDLHQFTDGYDAWLWDCNGTNPQQFTVKRTLDPSGKVPPKAQYDQAKTGLATAQANAKQQLQVLKDQLAAARKAATTSAAAEQAAYTIADRQGAPRGRGLLVGEQKNQVTQGAAAALEAMVKAGETAEAATRASAADASTIAQRAVAQSAQVKAEFRRKAAQTAEAQAKSAADAAKASRDQAKKYKDTAETKLGEAMQAEADAKAAAADAHAKRLAAEAEEKTAQAQKETAAAKQAEASRHKQNAQSEAAKADSARTTAQQAEQNAKAKRDDAVKARDHAQAMRDDAWDAEQKADAARAKADAKRAYADSLDAGDAAGAARAEADKAAMAATQAENAAVKARSEADAATKAAADADAAASRAEAAAKRARADADAAQAAKLKADAAVKTATAAVADAIQASQQAAGEARNAVKYADEADARAATAKTDADSAAKEAVTARTASAKAAGYAYITAQAAVDASSSAQGVARPANDAVELGSPYIETDSAASLVVLTGQASKTIAEQQQAVAAAHAANAQQEALAAQGLADQASADTKAAYQAAANAKKYAADARGFAKEALEYAAQAATAAKKAAESLARTVGYDQQATADASAADQAAGRAEGYATQARASADQAALDAEAARKAASDAEQAAKDARAAADRADAAATEAEQAAKDAAKYAQEAQEAAERAENAQANKQVQAGGATGIGGVFYVIDPEASTLVSAKQVGECPTNAPLVGCTATYELVMDVVADFYLCTDADALATAEGCPKKSWQYLDRQTIKGDPGKPVSWTHHFSAEDILRAGWQSLFGDKLGAFLFEIVLGDAIRCFHGDGSSCAWTAAVFLPVGKPLELLANAVKALDAAVKTGIGIEDAWRGLRAAKVSEQAIEGVGAKLLGDLLTKCVKKSARMPSIAAVNGPCEGIIAYGSSELSRMAYKARIAAGIYPGRNVAVARVPGWNDPRTGDLVVGFSKGDGYHSENHILDQLAARNFKPSQITELYSERSPCAACAPLLEDVLTPGTPISWSVPNGPGSANLLARMIKAYGG